jgi:hypothetical protein
VNELPPLAAGTRVIIASHALWGDLDRKVIEVAGVNGSGWVVEADYRPLGLIVLCGTSPLGEPRTWHPNPADIRAEATP